MRAPPESLKPTNGTPAFRARSMTLQIFLLCISPSDPARLVKSWAKANTGRPFTLPKPVTTPSAGISTFSMPKLTQRCVTKISVSRKVPGSKNRSSRSRAVSLPLARCFSTALAPPIRLDLPFLLLQLPDLLGHGLHRRFLFNQKYAAGLLYRGEPVCPPRAHPGGAPTKDENYLFECNPAKTTGIDIEKA